MPLTAEQFIRTMNLAEKFRTDNEELRRMLKQIHEDISWISARLRIEDDEGILDRLQIAEITASRYVEYLPDTEEIMHLAEQRMKFKMNRAKNANQARRMRLVRARRKEGAQATSPRIRFMSPEEIAQDAKEYEEWEREQKDQGLDLTGLSPGPAARSEQIPEDDPQSWGIKKKE